MNSNFEESAKAFESDYRFAPVGMGVVSFWGGSLTAGIAMFLMSTLIAKGALVPTSIHDNSRTLFASTTKALDLGIAVAVVLTLISILVGVVGLSAVNKKRDLKSLWKLAMAIPAISFIGTILAIAVYH